MIKDVLIAHLDVIDTPGGNVMHGIKDTSAWYTGFGEAYFSQVDQGAIKSCFQIYGNNMTSYTSLPI